MYVSRRLNLTERKILKPALALAGQGTSIPPAAGRAEDLLSTASDAHILSLGLREVIQLCQVRNVSYR